MSDNDYLLPGVVALLLAIIFPAYWVAEIVTASDDINQSLLNNLLQFGFSDLVYLLTGLMSIYIYWSFKKILNDQLNFKSIDAILTMMIGVTVLYFLVSFGLDVAASLFGSGFDTEHQELIVRVVFVFSAGCMIVFGLLDIVIAVVLLYHWSDLPNLLRAFAIVTLIQGWFELTVFFSVGVIIIFPVALLLLAMHFLSRPQMVEVV